MNPQKYKHITIDDTISQSEGKVVYIITNNKSRDVLGYLKWHGWWRQWVFEPYDLTTWSASCLRDVIDFIDNHAGKSAAKGKS